MQKSDWVNMSPTKIVFITKKERNHKILRKNYEYAKKLYQFILHSPTGTSVLPDSYSVSHQLPFSFMVVFIQNFLHSP